MKCVECNCTTTTFDERMGETICADCGLILSVNIFEESSKNIFLTEKSKGYISNNYNQNSNDSYKLGSIIERKDVKSKTDYALRTNNMRMNHNDSENKVLVATGIYLSYYNGGKLKNEVIKKFRILKDEHLVRGLPLDDVAAGIVYYVLKERGVPVSLKDYSKKINVPIKNIMRTSKRVTRKFGKPHIFSQLKTDEMLQFLMMAFRTNP